MSVAGPKPTKDDLATARRVLRYYLPKVEALSRLTGQERPGEWLLGCEVWLSLLKKDPNVVLRDYEEEWRVGHEMSPPSRLD
jgi:hypothetical protein